MWRDSRVGEGALFSIMDKGVGSARRGAPTVSVVANKPTGWSGARPPPATRARPPKPRTPPPPSAWRPPAPSSRPPGASWPATRAASEPTRRQAARRTGPRGLGCGAPPSETAHRLCETEKVGCVGRKIVRVRREGPRGRRKTAVASTAAMTWLGSVQGPLRKDHQVRACGALVGGRVAAAPPVAVGASHRDESNVSGDGYRVGGAVVEDGEHRHVGWTCPWG